MPFALVYVLFYHVSMKGRDTWKRLLLCDIFAYHHEGNELNVFCFGIIFFCFAFGIISFMIIMSILGNKLNVFCFDMFSFSVAWSKSMSFLFFLNNDEQNL